MFNIFFRYLLDFLMLVDLLNEVKRIMPDVLILFGPFLDKKNSLIQEGIIEVNENYFSYEEFSDHLFYSISTELAVQIFVYLI